MSELDQYIADDTIFSFQLNGRASDLSGELNLLASVLHDAYNQYILTFKNPNKLKLEKRQELEEWFTTDEGVFSFESICTYIGYNPGRARQHFNKIKEDLLLDATKYKVKPKAIPSLHKIIPTER